MLDALDFLIKFLEYCLIYPVLFSFLSSTVLIFLLLLHLLLWVGDKCLEIYNTTTWREAEDKDKTKPVLDVFENYIKPQSNQILSRYQLRCLKQGDMSLEEFVTKVCLLVDDSGYPAAIKQETLRDTLVFGLRSDKVRRDAIAKKMA